MSTSQKVYRKREPISRKIKVKIKKKLINYPITNSITVNTNKKRKIFLGKIFNKFINNNKDKKIKS